MNHELFDCYFRFIVSWIFIKCRSVLSSRTSHYKIPTWSFKFKNIMHFCNQRDLTELKSIDYGYFSFEGIPRTLHTCYITSVFIYQLFTSVSPNILASFSCFPSKDPCIHCNSSSASANNSNNSLEKFYMTWYDTNGKWSCKTKFIFLNLLMNPHASFYSLMTFLMSISRIHNSISLLTVSSHFKSSLSFPLMKNHLLNLMHNYQLNLNSLLRSGKPCYWPDS